MPKRGQSPRPSDSNPAVSDRVYQIPDHPRDCENAGQNSASGVHYRNGQREPDTL